MLLFKILKLMFYIFGYINLAFIIASILFVKTEFYKADVGLKFNQFIFIPWKTILMSDKYVNIINWKVNQLINNQLNKKY